MSTQNFELDGKLKSELEHHVRFTNRHSEEYLNEKKKAWESVIRLIPDVEGPILEIGNGPYGFFMYFGDRSDLYCVDPLNDEYHATFPHMNRFKKVHFIGKRIEDIDEVPKCRTVLCFNVLDHVDDLEGTIEVMLKNSTDDAVFLIAVDYYENEVIGSFMKKTWKYIDPPHPHHLSMKELVGILSKHFKIEQIINDDVLYLVHENAPKVSLAGKLGKAIRRPGVAFKVFSFKAITVLGLAGKNPRPNMKKLGIFLLKRKSNFL